jgi:hypothetical protein
LKFILLVYAIVNMSTITTLTTISRFDDVFIFKCYLKIKCFFLIYKKWQWKKKRSFVNMYGLISFGLLWHFSRLLILSFSSFMPLWHQFVHSLPLSLHPFFLSISRWFVRLLLYLIRPGSESTSSTRI